MDDDQTVLELTALSKSYGGRRVVDGVSFAQRRGTILGLVGPNGAGKTTLIRMIMGIVVPEEGAVQVLGVNSARRARRRVGYLPEERGLYQKQTVRRVLRYLAKLKGVGRHRSDRRMEVWLERLDVAETLDEPVRELSKGMQQKVQFVATVLHDPDLLLLDEPFGGLDPLSRQQLRAILQELAGNGKTVLLSSHEMAEVELLCPEVVLIHHGRTVLSGSVDAIKAQHGDHAVLVRGDGDWASVPGVDRVEREPGGVRVTIAADCAPSEFLRRAVAAGASVDHFEVARPSLEDVFVLAVQADGSGSPA